MMDVYLYGLPKISFNSVYAGLHWSKRKKVKDNYRLIVKNQFKHVFSKKETYIVNYIFTWKNRPLDATNCALSAKIIEDIIFEDDSYKTIDTIQIQSRKGERDKVKISIEIK